MNEYLTSSLQMKKSILEELFCLHCINEYPIWPVEGESVRLNTNISAVIKNFFILLLNLIIYINEDINVNAYSYKYAINSIPKTELQSSSKIQSSHLRAGRDDNHFA